MIATNVEQRLKEKDHTINILFLILDHLIATNVTTLRKEINIIWTGILKEIILSKKESSAKNAIHHLKTLNTSESI